MANNERLGVEGILTIREFSKETGELIGEYEDKNVITELGMNTLFLRMALADADTTMKLQNIVLGEDYGIEEDASGGWTVFNPKPAEKHYTTSNQFSVYAVPEADMVFDYPDQNTLQIGTLLDGKYILDTFFPNEVDMRYTSATFRFANATTFSYKRFPIRSLSRLIDVQIVWTFRFINSSDYVCPLPEYDALIQLYSLEGTLMRYAGGDLSATQVDPSTNINDVKVRPNGDLFYIDATNQLKVLDETLAVVIDRALVATGTIQNFDLDKDGNILALQSGTSSMVAKYNSAGDLQWEVEVGAGAPRSIWAVDNNRIAVSLEDTVDFSLATTNNKVYILRSDTGSILYTGSYDIGTLAAGYYDLFSSSGGELFVAQRAPVSTDPSNLIKVNYDLTEIERVALPDQASSFYAVHDNHLVVGLDDGRLFRYDADLNYIRDSSVTGAILGVSVDRDRDLYLATASTITKMAEDGSTLLTASTTSTPISISAVGSKWTYFGS